MKRITIILWDENEEEANVLWPRIAFLKQDYDVTILPKGHMERFGEIINELLVKWKIKRGK